MAQSVEQLIRNQQAAGSSPATSSKKRGHPQGVPLFFKSDKMMQDPALFAEGKNARVGEWVVRGFWTNELANRGSQVRLPVDT